MYQMLDYIYHLKTFFHTMFYFIYIILKWALFCKIRAFLYNITTSLPWTLPPFWAFFSWFLWKYISLRAFKYISKKKSLRASSGSQMQFRPKTTLDFIIIEKQAKITLTFFLFPITYHWLLFLKVKYFCLTKLSHHWSMSNDWQLIQGLGSMSSAVRHFLWTLYLQR